MTPKTYKAVALFFSLVLVRSVTLAQPVITNPSPGATNTSASMTFQWSSGSGVTEYYLSVGSFVGGSDIYGQNMGLNLSTTITNLPTNGMTLYIQLSWLTSAGWKSYAQTNTAFGVATPVPKMISPAQGSKLTSSSATFQWSSGTGVTKYTLYVGSSLGQSALCNQNVGLNLSATATNLPSDGRTLYVRLWWLTGTDWQSSDYIYTAFGTNTPIPLLISPVPGSTLPSSSATFQWSAGTGVSKFYLAVGSSLGATDIAYQNENLNLSTTIAGLPTNGMTTYVRLWWLVSNAWQSGDYSYIAPVTLGARRQGGNFIISWPTNDPTYWLEYATNLPASSWISNSIAPSILNGRYTVTNGTPNPFTIYRLTK